MPPSRPAARSSDPPANPPADADVWAANARAWTRAVRERRIASRTAGTDAAVVDALRRLSPWRLLDVGCGEGWLVRALGRQLPDCRAVGLDGARALIAAARAADPAGSYHVLSYAGFAASGWRDDPVLAECLADPFDAVVFNYALFDRDLVPVLTAARRLLAADGALVVQTLPPCPPGAEGWRREDFAGFGGADDGWAPVDWYDRSRAAWDAALEAAGLRLVQAETPTHPGDGTPLSYLMVARPA
jgi:SAM-dependent methyltransferase